MRFNSAFTGFLNHRLVVRPGITTVMLLIFFTVSSFRNIDRDLQAKQVNLIIRQIGHRLLLQAGDSTSRVLPVTEKDGTFLLRFENELVFSHDSLMMLSQNLLLKKMFPHGYTVTVHDCKKRNIVYGFQLNNTSPDILACNGRSEPVGCYSIEFAFPDFYAATERDKADVSQLTKSAKADHLDVNLKGEGLQTAALGYNIEQQTKQLKSVATDGAETNSKLREFKKEQSSYSLRNIVYGGMLVLLGVSITLLIGSFGKASQLPPLQDQDHVITKEAIAELPSLGKFLFDEKGQRLVLGNEVISLTDKEYKVLELLNNNFGELIPRETLMQEVWINEGVITGRSLDMFISKLRKKLSPDADLRITNIHGKGYRLEVVDESIT
jgi:DNA-binding winged helix-turn-helix (wHTH) protein